MMKATEFMYLMFLFLSTKAPTVSGSFQSNCTAVQFAVSYLSKDIPEKDFKNATLGVEYAACQVFDYYFTVSCFELACMEETVFGYENLSCFISVVFPAFYSNDSKWKILIGIMFC